MTVVKKQTYPLFYFSLSLSFFSNILQNLVIFVPPCVQLIKRRNVNAIEAQSSCTASCKKLPCGAGPKMDSETIATKLRYVLFIVSTSQSIVCHRTSLRKLPSCIFHFAFAKTPPSGAKIRVCSFQGGCYHRVSFADEVMLYSWSGTLDHFFSQARLVKPRQQNN